MTCPPTQVTFVFVYPDMFPSEVFDGFGQYMDASSVLLAMHGHTADDMCSGRGIIKLLQGSVQLHNDITLTTIPRLQQTMQIPYFGILMATYF